MIDSLTLIFHTPQIAQSIAFILRGDWDGFTSVLIPRPVQSIELMTAMELEGVNSPMCVFPGMIQFCVQGDHCEYEYCTRPSKPTFMMHGIMYGTIVYRTVQAPPQNSGYIIPNRATPIKYIDRSDLAPDSADESPGQYESIDDSSSNVRAVLSNVRAYLLPRNDFLHIVQGNSDSDRRLLEITNRMVAMAIADWQEDANSSCNDADL
ncbi:hypothetical protein S7335_1308 [Synechococcus sp. PCC 7335]|uniref:hypothetical protein n=1 Tax=Synechococcus sp. (strain ATCC 29403 / PCC 7335) TaxID=91464 RepID=UPI00017EB91D|nr:hypothetical protein [Synechococcus sp. PCC 7335]EDX82604.1 hypothetical protein S7335_1308 [Synechococcus sp. PCC 7335]